MSSIYISTIPNFPHIQAGDDIAQLLLETLRQNNTALQNGDVLALAHKVISKAEGRLVNLSAVIPSQYACDIAEQVNKDPRLVELILQESDEISRMKPGVLIVRHRLGFTSANAGIDRSNVRQEAGQETVLLLPLDPDDSAARLRKAIREALDIEVGVLIVDSHGRPFRLGTVGVAIGAAGLPTLWDRRGESDLYGYHLEHTDVGTADEIAAAASLLMGQAAEGTPIVLIRGLKLPANHGKAIDLVRPKTLDMYRS
jgi:coenzyme F420-0:L-glutamate ligase/coenzyme F420-1:gamma-L-glutamate ligase